MSERTLSDACLDLFEGLEDLEALMPNLDGNGAARGSRAKREELRDEIRDLEMLIATAGDPDDEHSLAALTFLETELIRKRSLLDSLH